MKSTRKILTAAVSVLLVAIIAVSTSMSAFSFDIFSIFRKNDVADYTMSSGLANELNSICSSYNFDIGWGIYDISSGSARAVTTRSENASFQSNCTIKAMMLMLICRKMDAGELSVNTMFNVNTGALSYHDFGRSSGKYSVGYLLQRMIIYSNNCCYETFLRYVTIPKFNEFLSSLGSSTRVTSYGFMGYCTVRDRAIEWNEIYNYCHSGNAHSSYAWNLFTTAKFSPIRDGLGRAVAHKSGWYYSSGTHGTAGDCAVVSSDNGGCYLMIIFTKNRAYGDYSEALIRKLAVTLDKVWNEYYKSNGGRSIPFGVGSSSSSSSSSSGNWAEENNRKIEKRLAEDKAAREERSESRAEAREDRSESRAQARNDRQAEREDRSESRAQAREDRSESGKAASEERKAAREERSESRAEARADRSESMAQARAERQAARDERSESRRAEMESYTFPSITRTTEAA